MRSSSKKPFWNDPHYRALIALLQCEEAENTKLCTGCFLILPIDRFQNCTNGRKRVLAYCRYCASDKAKDRYSDGTTRNSRYKRLYSISLDEVESRWLLQKEKCAICGRPDPGRATGRYIVDHCHSTGVVRGILCHKCNSAIGMMEDDPARLEAAAAYLRKHHGE